MGLGKKIGGGLKIAGGIASEVVAPGNPAGMMAISSGTGDILGDIGSGKGKGSTTGPRKTEAPGPEGPPVYPPTSSSFEQHRQEQRKRNPITLTQV